MPELLIETYGPVQVFEHTGGQYIARCTSCPWKIIRWDDFNAKDEGGRHAVRFR